MPVTDAFAVHASTAFVVPAPVTVDADAPATGQRPWCSAATPIEAA